MLQSGIITAKIKIITEFDKSNHASQYKKTQVCSKPDKPKLALGLEAKLVLVFSKKFGNKNIYKTIFCLPKFVWTLIFLETNFFYS